MSLHFLLERCGQACPLPRWSLEIEDLAVQDKTGGPAIGRLDLDKVLLLRWDQRHARLQAGVQGGLIPRVGPECGQVLDRLDGLDMRPQKDVVGLDVKECKTGCYHQVYQEACINTVRKRLFCVSVYALQWLESP